MRVTNGFQPLLEPRSGASTAGLTCSLDIHSGRVFDMGIDGPVDPSRMHPSIESIVKHFEGISLRKAGDSSVSGMTEDQLRAALDQLRQNDVDIYELVALSASAIKEVNEAVQAHHDQLVLNKTQLFGLHERVQSLEQSRAARSIIGLMFFVAVVYLLLR